MASRIREFAKKIIFRHTRFGAPRYDYCIEPIQLAEIINGIERTLSHDKENGSIVEIGVARGMTSRFICEHLLNQRYVVDFYCLDTFRSFTKSDLEFEVEERGKSRSELVGFEYNNFEVWKRNFARYPFVKAVQCDASDFEFSTIAPIHLCFLDVDLYVPTKTVLSRIQPYLARKAVVIVDDVADNNRWDGAYQAFMEFVRENKLDYKIVGNRCGVISFPQ